MWNKSFELEFWLLLNYLHTFVYHLFISCFQGLCPDKIIIKSMGLKIYKLRIIGLIPVEFKRHIMYIFH